VSYERVNKLAVWRTLSNGNIIAVGELAQNKQGVYFQYNSNYLEQFSNLSPFNLNF
jgi:serine/threonine-protein kinase HipA